MSTFKEKLRAALVLDLPYEDRVQRELPAEITHPRILKSAAVLLLFAFDKNQMAHLLYIKRSDASNDAHRGQMAFPGGSANDPETSWDTALRETTEEVGIPADQIEKLGQLPELITVTGFLVRPMVGIEARPVEKIALSLNSDEIFATTWVSWHTLNRPGTYTQELFPARGRQFPIHVYTVPPYRIWGATGSMTKNLLDRCLAMG